MSFWRPRLWVQTARYRRSPVTSYSTVNHISIHISALISGPSNFTRFLFLMKSSVQISRGIESLFGTRDENIRLLESELSLRTRLMDGDSLELEGEEPQVRRAERILEDYVSLVKEGHVFNNGDLNSYMRVVTADPNVSLRRLVESGKSRAFGKKVLAPKTVNQRRYVDAIENHDLTFGIGPAGTGKTYLAVAMAVAALVE